MTSCAASARGHRQPVDAEQRPELGPGDLAVAGHQHEHVLVRGDPDHHRLDQLVRRRRRGPRPPRSSERTGPCRVDLVRRPSSRGGRDGASAARAGLAHGRIAAARVAERPRPRDRRDPAGRPGRAGAATRGRQRGERGSVQPRTVRSGPGGVPARTSSGAAVLQPCSAAQPQHPARSLGAGDGDVAARRVDSAPRRASVGTAPTRRSELPSTRTVRSQPRFTAACRGRARRHPAGRARPQTSLPQASHDRTRDRLVGAAGDDALGTPARRPRTADLPVRWNACRCDASWAPRSSTASRWSASPWPTRWSRPRRSSTPTPRPPSKARRARWDFEEESPLRDARGFDMSPADRRPHPAHRRGPRPGQRHPHQRRPALRRPRAPGVLHARGDQPARRRALGQGRRAGHARRLAAGRPAARRHADRLYKNNTDNKGASYGAHENYLMRRVDAVRRHRAAPDAVLRHPPGRSPAPAGSASARTAASTASRSASAPTSSRSRSGSRPRSSGRSSTPATSRTPTRRSTAGCT